ncbi:MAG: hypothetical protein LBI17_01860 [Rickettsiales bacterium]|jgi:hypothetical protein|nr:hypothetical protein [Rickettsiales bacterium]
MKKLLDRLDKVVHAYGDPCLVTKAYNGKTTEKNIKIPIHSKKPYTSSRKVFPATTPRDMLKYYIFYWTHLVPLRISKKLNEQHYG